MAALGAAVAVAAVRGGSQRSDAVRLTVDVKSPGRAIASGFAGISTEYWAIPEVAGKDPSAANRVFEQLLRNLAPGGRPVLRIGGDSTDWTWWPIRGMRKPLGIRYTLTPQWLRIVRALAKETNARLILGINLEAGSRRLAVGEARALLGGLGRPPLQALEIGNEPELYGSFGWYRTSTGREVPGRPRGYDPQLFTSDFSYVAGSMPSVALAGPSAGSARYDADLGPFLARERRVGLATVHAYPLKHCSPGTRVTTGQLLSSESSDGLAGMLAPLAATAHRHHRPLQVDEMNAVSCGGVRGVSDTYASALWVLDSLFALARAGVDGVNLHSPPRSINQIFTFRQAKDVWEAHVAPVYYGMLMFARATPPGSRLLRISGSAVAGLATWATRGSDGKTRVVLINKSARQSRHVEVPQPSTASSATVELLRARDIAAKGGITLGGQSFGAQTTTGLLAGTPTTTTVKPAQHRFSVQLPAGSAALLTVS
jgi:Glycosyl hydrolase family 79 C-terminal beta domain